MAEALILVRPLRLFCLPVSLRDIDRLQPILLRLDTWALQQSAADLSMLEKLHPLLVAL